MAFWFLLLMPVVAALYVRFAPSDPTRWHHPAKIEGTETRQFKTGYVWRGDVPLDGSSALAALDQVALAAPRTKRLAGSVDEGRITYIARSAGWGFPDYITASLKTDKDGQSSLELYGRSRFGGSDFGVNASRIKRWVAAAQL